MRRFWAMLAHDHGEIWNGSELARAFGGERSGWSPGTRTWPSARSRRPRSTSPAGGLLHALLGLATREDLLGHPKVGASWEGFALGEVAAHLGARPEECFFWKLHSGAELDLLVRRGSVRRGFELKLTSSPRVTPSMRSALEVLRLDELTVIHAGAESYPLAPRIRAVALARLREEVAPLG
jgi:hypothetical protein